jgi:molecular chaperone HtpG
LTTDVHSNADDPALADAAAPKTQSFEADVSRLLHLMVHSVYSDRNIFVRELISNAADACEKLRYEALAKPELIEGGGPFAITLSVDPEAKTLTFSDNGVGMSREELVDALGTIARSGTRAFLDRLAQESPAEEAKEATSLIGQFGIGFYSSFMVADEVVVDTRRAGSTEAWRWSSNGKGAFTIAPLDLAEAPPRGASNCI